MRIFDISMPRLIGSYGTMVAGVSFNVANWTQKLEDASHKGGGKEQGKS
jgi:hypothetical protein